MSKSPANSRRFVLALSVLAVTAGCAQDLDEAEKPKSQEEPIKVTIGGYYRSGFVVGQP